MFIIGLRGGGLPALALAGGGQRGGGARLCYVGITRAGSDSDLTHARSRRLFGGRETGIPSRFLSEIPRSWSSGTGTEAQADQRLGAGRLRRPRRRRPIASLAFAHRGRHRPRELRRRGRHRGRAGRGDSRALRQRRSRAQADGRLRPAAEGQLMAATVIDGKADGRVGARAGARRGRGAHRSAAARRGSRRCWSATTRPPPSTCAASARPARRPGFARSTTSPSRNRPGGAAGAGRGDLNEDDEVDGILVQLPLPEHLDPDPVVAAIDPAKDVDGLTPTSAGPARPRRARLGALHAAGRDGADRDRLGWSSEGAEAVIVGRGRTSSARRSSRCCSARTQR